MDDDAPIESVELGADRQPLGAASVGARGGDHLLRGVVTAPRYARGRSGAARSGHRLGHQSAPLGGHGAAPVDVEHRDRAPDGVGVSSAGGAPELGGQERHGAIEPGAGAEVHGLGDGEPEEALDDLVGSDAGLVDHEEPVSGSEAPKLLLYECWQATTVRIVRAALGEQGVEVRADQLVQQVLLGLASAEIPGERHMSRSLGLLEERRAGCHHPGPQGPGFLSQRSLARAQKPERCHFSVASRKRAHGSSPAQPRCHGMEHGRSASCRWPALGP